MNEVFQKEVFEKKKLMATKRSVKNYLVGKELVVKMIGKQISNSNNCLEKLHTSVWHQHVL